MRGFFKVFLGLVFSLLFFIFVLLSAVNFQFLNRNYLFSVFESQQIYSQLPPFLASSLPNDPNLPREEREGYAEIVKNLSPEIFEQTIKENITNSFDFIWGKTDEIAVFIPAKGLGIGRSDFLWNPTPELAQRIKIVNGIGQKIFLAWVFVLVILLGCYLLYSRLTNSKKLSSANALLIINGSLLVIFGLLMETAMYLVPQTLPTQLEPSQALLKFAFSTILPPMVWLWVIAGALLSVLGLVLKKLSGKGKGVRK